MSYPDRHVKIPTAADLHKRSALQSKPVFCVKGVAHPDYLPPHLKHLAFGTTKERLTLWGEEDLLECIELNLENRKQAEAAFGNKKSLDSINK